mmetsp:Transcript_14354/g.17392  ORF Transcript_14354/g.17392 Transcript_14354/m.17392 type:complete len:271 (-) Transcript_14354:1912-2724(-)
MTRLLHEKSASCPYDLVLSCSSGLRGSGILDVGIADSGFSGLRSLGTGGLVLERDPRRGLTPLNAGGPDWSIITGGGSPLFFNKDSAPFGRMPSEGVPSLEERGDIPGLGDSPRGDSALRALSPAIPVIPEPDIFLAGSVRERARAGSGRAADVLIALSGGARPEDAPPPPPPAAAALDISEERSRLRGLLRPDCGLLTGFSLSAFSLSADLSSVDFALYSLSPLSAESVGTTGRASSLFSSPSTKISAGRSRGTAPEGMSEEATSGSKS